MRMSLKKLLEDALTNAYRHLVDPTCLPASLTFVQTFSVADRRASSAADWSDLRRQEPGASRSRSTSEPGSKDGAVP